MWRLCMLGAGLVAMVAACSLDFDALDPRVGTQGPGGSTAVSTSATSSSSTAGGEAGLGGRGGESAKGGDGGAGGSDDLGPFTNVQPIAGLNTSMDEDDPSLTDDLLELYFNSNRDLSGTDIYVSTRETISDPWGPPTAVAELNTTNPETNCEVSGDGLTIWFSRRISGNGLLYEIYRSTRTSRTATWETPSAVAELNSPDEDFFGRTTADGLYLLMSSNRDDPDGITNIFEVDRPDTATPWSKPSMVGALSQLGVESEVWLSNDGLEAWFTRNASDTLDDDLYRAVRSARSAPWGPGSPAVELNTAIAESDPHLSPDLRYIVFTRTIAMNDRDLYEASR